MSAATAVTPAGILPRFVIPADVRDLKNRLDPVVRSLDQTVAACPGANDFTKQSWQGFSGAWRSFFAEADSWWHTAAQMDQAESYEKQIADWQHHIAALNCKLATPILEPSSSAPGTVSSTIKTVAIAGAVIAGALVVRSLMSK